VIWPLNTPPWEARFAFDDSGAYINNKAYAMSTHDTGLVCYLCSPICLWLVEKLTTKLRGGWIELKSEEVVGLLPIPAGVAGIDAYGAPDSDIHRLTSKLMGLSEGESAEIWTWYLRRQVYQRESVEDTDEDD